jgi:glycerol transport system ATP-binding protein
MARIDLDLAHSYQDNPQQDEDYALLPMKMSFADGGAYALLGPRVAARRRCSTSCRACWRLHGEASSSTAARHATQSAATQYRPGVPVSVIYDTMTVADNLASPCATGKCPAIRSGSASLKLPKCWN